LVATCFCDFFLASLEHEKLWMAISFSFLHPIEPFEGLGACPQGWTLLFGLQRQQSSNLELEGDP
jgi:hypothetical protein